MIERQKTKYVTLRDYLSVVDIPERTIIHFIKDDKIIKIKNIEDLTDDELNMLVDTTNFNEELNVYFLYNELNVYVLYGEYNINDEDIDKVDDEYYQFEEVD